MITNERLTVIVDELINHLSESLGSSNRDELYNILSNCIGMTDNEIDQLCGNFDGDREGFGDDVEIRYCVCALGYDANGCVTDYERDFGDFAFEDEAFECYNAVVREAEDDIDMFFRDDQPVSCWKIQLEKCEETDEEINCIDILAETNIERSNNNV